MCQTVCMMAAQKVILLIPVLVFLTQLCVIEVRAVDGNWGAWLEWDPCSASCGEGQRRRMRFCNNPPPSNGGAYCAGRAIQYQECEAPVGCPVDGGWSEWSAWTPSSVTCGAGIKSRQRNCDSPPPANGGRNCAGRSEERTKYASEEDCPRNGGWSSWSKWSPCSVTCGRGFSFRYRECDNPPPSDNGKDCAGRTQETRECTAKIECADTPVCASPPDIEGAITSQLNHPVGTTVTYTCPYGFESRNSNNNVSVCTVNPTTGRPEWTAPEISCIVITCDPPKNIENGQAIALSFQYGSELEYKCNKGFSLNTNETIYCTEDGIWSKTDVACIVITCDPPKNIENGHAIALSFDYGSELEYKCDEGFSLNTHETIYCTEEGIWSTTDVACIGLQKGHKLFYRDGGVFVVTCNQNYRLDTGNIGRIMCKEGAWTGDLSPCVPECGTNRIGRESDMPLVTSVTNANEGTWPWMAAIIYKEWDGLFTPLVTGFLIDKNHVVSVASFFTEKEPDLYRVLLGSVAAEAGEEYFITRIVVPEVYAESSFHDDIAILTLSRHVDIPNFAPVCLPDNRIKNMDLASTGTTVAGWDASYSRQKTHILKQLLGIPVLSNEECETPVKEFSSVFPRGLTSDIFCTRNERDSRGVCKFTMGSPLMLLDRNRWYAVGIVSRSCGRNNDRYVVYTRVTSYLDWIRENTRD